MSKDEMRAITIDRFGGPEVLSVRTVPMPKPAPNQILIRVASAGIGIWDVGEREGVLARAQNLQAKFPWILGSEGAGQIVELGANVTGLKVGDLVYGHTWATNQKAGFYAEYTTVEAANAWPIPSTLPARQAGALLIDGGTALTGLDDTLALKRDETLMVFGASGGLGHLVVQLGKRLGARVFAVASGEDGTALALRLGADAAVDGRKANVIASAREFAPRGFDAALVTVRGQVPEAIKATEDALTTMRQGGRVAYPWSDSIMPPPQAPSTVRRLGYMAKLDRDSVIKLNRLIDAGAFEVHLGRTFTLDQAVQAFDAVNSHHLGRLALLPAS